MYMRNQTGFVRVRITVILGDVIIAIDVDIP